MNNSSFPYHKHNVNKNDFDAAMQDIGAENYQKASGRNNLEQFFIKYGEKINTSSNAYRPCPLCGATAAVLFGMKYNIPIVDCPCGFRYAGSIEQERIDQHSLFNTKMDDEHVKFINSDTYIHYTQLRSAYELQLIEKTINDRDELRYEREKKAWLDERTQARPDENEPSVEPLKILDVGCGTGIFLDVAAQRGWHVTGVEPNRRAWEIASQKHKHVSCNWFTPEELKKPFDIVTLLDVLEHIQDPVHFLVSVRKVIKDNGFLFIQVPNTWSLACQLRGLEDNIYNGLIHFNYFSPQSLEAVCKKASFSVVHKDSILSELSIVRQHTSAECAKHLQNLDSLSKEAAAEKIHNALMGYKILFVCKKATT